jgi:uncharacterized protein YjeT (DUF2065 family)
MLYRLTVMWGLADKGALLRRTGLVLVVVGVGVSALLYYSGGPYA